MSDMVENVARAIRDRSATAGYPAGSHMRAMTFPDVVCLDLARAAIEAMVEPTEAMIEAGANATRYDMDEPPEYVAAKAYQAILSAALNPPTPSKETTE